MRLIDVSEYNLKNGLIQWVEYGEHSISLHSKMLHEIPTVDAMPVVHGRWEPLKNWEGMFRCSLCGDEWGAAAKMVPMRYCPSCGAKMDLEEQHDD